jgi:tetratricopeptide (TPR) repeat protein
MILFKQHIQRKSRWIAFFLVVGLLFGYGIQSGHAQSENETVSATASPAEQVEKLLKEADNYFQLQEFAAGYELYLQVLGLDPSNQQARGRIYEIINIYKTLMDTAQKEGESDQVELYYQKYRTIIRSLLQTLTNQLKRTIQKYGELVKTQKTGIDVSEEIIPILSNIIQILQDLKTVYEDYPQGDSGTEKMVERINKTIKKYEQEFSQYQ